MKSDSLSLVLVADQRRSRSNPDRVPQALAALAPLDALLGFERTAGDEVQALLGTPEAAVGAVQTLSRLGDWRIGLGLGTVERPLPTSTRAARGPAYLAAREAIGRAHRSPAGLAVRLSADAGDVATLPYGDRRETVAQAETVLWMLRALWGRRSEEGWELTELQETGMTSAAAARRLGVSASAVSQRRAAGYLAETERGVSLAVGLLSRALRGPA